jgi:GxxExxY protein
MLTQSRRDTEMKDINIISGQIVDAAMQVHTRLGPGLLESIYERVLAYELEKRGLKVDRQVAIPLRYDNLSFEEGFRADLIVDETMLVELKSVEVLAPVHGKQVLTYLKLTNLRLGLLINFGAAMLKDGIKRIANNL